MQKNLIFFLVFSVLILFLFGCASQENKLPAVDEQSPKVAGNDVNQIPQIQTEPFKANQICSDDGIRFDYAEEHQFAKKALLAKDGDFNAHGYCSTYICYSYMSQKMIIGENEIKVSGVARVDLDLKEGMQQKIGIGFYLPKDSNGLKIIFGTRVFDNFLLATSNDDFNVSLPIITQNVTAYTVKYFFPTLNSGKNIFEYSYTYTPQKACANNICVYPVIFFGDSSQMAELEVTSQNGRVLNNYKKIFRGYKEQLLAISGEQVFRIGNFLISESQRNMYLAYDKRIERVTKNIHYPEFFVGQKVPENIFLFFTDNLNTSGSFTYNSGGLIVMNTSYNGEEFEEVLMHELTHTTVSNPYLPNWLNEGIGFFVGAAYSGYLDNIPKLNNEWYIITDFDEKEYWMPDYTLENYNYSANIVKNFIEKYGCDKFKAFLKKLNSLNPAWVEQKDRMEEALRATIGDYSYKDLINNKI